MRRTSADLAKALVATGIYLSMPAPAAAEPLPASGAYLAEIRLELPHLDDGTARKTARLCLTAEPGAGHHGLAVLSDNNPLARCPVSDIRREGGRLTFAIACEGRNAARASAAYEFTAEGFRGRITMNMGGKNMTMTEVQLGRRVGACDGAPSR